MPTTRETGALAETLAIECLEKKGLVILDKNWHYGHLELDIVARDGKELVIVEVKSRSGIRYDHPLEAVTKVKIKRIVEAADAYILQKDIDLDTRFDVITVIFFKPGHELEHYKDAFYPTL